MNGILTPKVVEDILTWYDENRRDLPWRMTRDPYRIWLSEIMLQQTRVEAVKPYYHRFLESCSDMESLAIIPEEYLMKLWEGLGYYSRARNLQKAAKLVMETYGGEMPRTYAELLKLPGIGEYTAGAIASIAFGERVPAVDGNVLRVLARVMGARNDIMLPETKKAWREALLPLIPIRAGDFNQALIELGATVCIPNGEAKCSLCPLGNACRARQEGTVDMLPVRGAKKPRRIEKKTVFILQEGTATALSKRPDKGLLAGLYQLPNTEGHLTVQEAEAYLAMQGIQAEELVSLETAKHVFTHIEWHMIAYRARIFTPSHDFAEKAGLVMVPREGMQETYAIPSAFSAYIKYL